MKNFRKYINQSWQIIKQNKLYSFFYILGTALAISMVMVIAIGYNLKVGNIYPQVNRDRTLVLNTLQNKSEGYVSQGGFAFDVIKKLVEGVEGIEAVCTSIEIYPESVQKDVLSVEKEKLVYYGDEGAWQVYQFDFVEGKPFTKEDVEYSNPQAVISVSTAKSFFGDQPVVGKKILIGYKEFTICGVVKDVSHLMFHTYADIYLPYKFTPIYLSPWGASDMSGGYSAQILAKSQKDFDRIKVQIEENLAKINNTLDGVELSLLGGPKSFVEDSLTMDDGDKKTSAQKHILQLIVIVLIIIMVPAINLSGIISTEMEDRESEVGIRKAFGASRGRLLYRLLTENLLLSFLGGCLGLLFSYVMIFIGYQRFLNFLGINQYYSINFEYTWLDSIGMLLNYKVLIVAFIGCLLINLLSSIIPQYFSTKKNIISLLQRNHFIKKRTSARQKSVWIFFELLAVFVITWMVIDPLYVLNYQKNIYDGFEHKDLYRVHISSAGSKPPEYKEETAEEVGRNNKIVLDMIKNHPLVENVGRQDRQVIMDISDRKTNIRRSLDDSITIDVAQIYMPLNSNKHWFYDNFWVYGIKTTEKSDETTIQEGTVLISKSIAKKLFGDSRAIGKNILEDDYPRRVVGVIDDIKSMQYKQPEPTIIRFTGIHSIFNDHRGMSLLVKSKPNISEAKFIRTFTEDLKDKIKINGRRLSPVDPYMIAIDRHNYGTVTPQKNTYTLIACFVLFNMFLGIFATFWLQSKKRRGEIGLRMAMGSSKKKVSRMFVMESVKMASLAALVGMIVVGNIVYFKGMFTYGEFQNPVYWAVTNDTAHFIIVSLIAYAVILITVTLGTLIPASKAANTNPVDALRDE